MQNKWVLKIFRGIRSENIFFEIESSANGINSTLDHFKKNIGKLKNDDRTYVVLRETD